MKENTGTQSRLKNDNDLHFNIMLSVGCYCDKVLHVSLPNESGCSVMRATKTFGRTCHPLLFSCKWAWEIYLCPPIQYFAEIRRGFWLIGRQLSSQDEPPWRYIERKTEWKKKKDGGEKPQHSRRCRKSSEKSKHKAGRMRDGERRSCRMICRSDNTWPRNKLEACLDAR